MEGSSTDLRLQAPQVLLFEVTFDDGPSTTSIKLDAGSDALVRPTVVGSGPCGQVAPGFEWLGHLCSQIWLGASSAQQAVVSTGTVSADPAVVPMVVTGQAPLRPGEGTLAVSVGAMELRPRRMPKQSLWFRMWLNSMPDDDEGDA